MLCFSHVAAYFIAKRFYILDTCIIFMRSCFSKRFQLSKRFCSCISAFLFLHKRFCFIFYVSQHLYIFLTVSQRAILLSSQIVMQLLFQFLDEKRLSL